MEKKLIAGSLILAAGLLAAAGCAHRPPPLVQAPVQEYTPKGEKQPWKIDGVYNKRSRDITIRFDGNNVLQGSIPPHYPRANLQGKYKNHLVAARCEFAADTGGGRRERIVYQAVRKNATNACQIEVDGKEAVWLYF